MFKSFFGVKKKPEISIFPEKASASVSSLALLLVTIGSPFSEWKPSDVPLTDAEELTIRPACHCYQLFLYPTYFKDANLGEVLLGSAMAVAEEQREGLMQLLNLGYSAVSDAFHAGVLEYGTEPEGIRKSIYVVALTLLHVFRTQGETLNEVEERALAEKMTKCLYHARDRANVIFEPMVNSIKDFDLDNIGQLSFFKNDLSLFERALQNRGTLGFLYPSFEAPSAYTQYLAKAKEDRAAQNLEERHESSLATLAEKLKAADLAEDGETKFEAIKEWFFASEDILGELRVISGKRCTLALKTVTKRQADILELVKPLLFDIFGPGANPDHTFAKLKQSCDDFHKKAWLTIALRHIPDDEIMSYVFSLSLEDFPAVKDSGIERPALATFIDSIGGLSSMSPEQREYVSERLALA